MNVVQVTIDNALVNLASTEFGIQKIFVHFFLRLHGTSP